MDINTLRVVITAASLICFLAIVLWAYSKSARKGFDEAAMLPFKEDELPGAGNDSGTVI